MSPQTTHTTVSPELRKAASIAFAVLLGRAGNGDAPVDRRPLLEWAQRLDRGIDRQLGSVSRPPVSTTETQDEPVLAARRAMSLAFLEELMADGPDPDDAWWSEFDGILRDRRFRL